MLFILRIQNVVSGRKYIFLIYAVTERKFALIRLPTLRLPFLWVTCFLMPNCAQLRVSKIILFAAIKREYILVASIIVLSILDPA